jgi:hypothetical protein
MLPLAFDENFNNDILRALRRQAPNLELLRVQDVGLSGHDDPTVLNWAAQERRVLFSHDVSTMTRYAYERVQAGQSMPGLFEVGRDVPLAKAIEDILLIAECSVEGEWEGQVRYLPI